MEDPTGIGRKEIDRKVEDFFSDEARQLHFIEEKKKHLSSENKRRKRWGQTIRSRNLAVDGRCGAVAILGFFLRNPSPRASQKAGTNDFGGKKVSLIYASSFITEDDIHHGREG